MFVCVLCCVVLWVCALYGEAGGRASKHCGVSLCIMEQVCAL